MLINKS